MRTTIDQHIGNHDCGLPITQFVEIRTNPTDFVSQQEYEAMAPADREAFDKTVEDIHDAKVELESLDVEPRNAAKMYLNLLDLEMDTEAAGIRSAINAVVVRPS